MNDETPGAWKTKQNILVILAHPDDPEFFCGATLARWAGAGHSIDYFLLTCGDKGSDDRQIVPDDLCRRRRGEQEAAARVIGVRQVYFMDQPDGYLLPTLELRREVTRVIRKFKPDILVTCDPQNLFPSHNTRVNHPDHRYAGQVVLDAVFPAAGNVHYFPELLAEGHEPWTPREVWVSLPIQPNVNLDVTDTWATKIHALKQHVSQIGDAAEFEARMLTRRTPESTDENPRYEEKFHVLRFDP